VHHEICTWYTHYRGSIVPVRQHGSKGGQLEAKVFSMTCCSMSVLCMYVVKLRPCPCHDSTLLMRMASKTACTSSGLLLGVMTNGKVRKDKDELLERRCSCPCSVGSAEHSCVKPGHVTLSTSRCWKSAEDVVHVHMTIQMLSGIHLA
jgi:hypothetical protein